MNQTLPRASQGQVSSSRPARTSRMETACWSVIVLITIALAAGYVYYSIFSIFRGYDDEGFVLMTLKSFFQGKPLYDQVYTSFQPGFYVLEWLIFKLWGAPLGHDTIRLLTLVFWLVAAGLNGVLTWRLTSSRLLGLLVSVVSVHCLEPFANEPGHPQALAYVLVVTVAVLLAFGGSLRPRPLAWAIGGLTALLLLIKINIGVFLLLPLTLIFTASRKGRLVFWLRFATGLSMLVLPIFLWRAQLGAKHTPLAVLGWLELMALLLLAARAGSWPGRIPVLTAAFIACAVALLNMNSVSVEALPVFSAGLLSLAICGSVLIGLADTGDLDLGRGHAVGALLAGGIVIGIITLITLGRGTTLHGLALGVLWLPAKISSSFVIQPRANWLGLCLGLLGATLAYAYLGSRTRWGRRGWFPAVLFAGQLSFGVAVLAEFYLQPPGPSVLMPLHYDLPHFWMLPFAWLVAVPETGGEETRPARLALLLIAVMQPLIACPVAGTQLVPASMLLCVVGAVCLGHGLRGLVRAAASGFRAPGGGLFQGERLNSGGLKAASLFAEAVSMRDSTGCRLVAVLIGAGLLLVPFGRETLRLDRAYAGLTPLNLPGARRIRLDAEQAQVYQEVVAQLARPEVGTFLTLPGLYSFYFWAQKDPPTDLNVSSWIILLDNQAQEKIWQSAQRQPGLMAVRNRHLVRQWVRGRPIDGEVLVRHIEQDFKPFRTYGGYEVLVRR